VHFIQETQSVHGEWIGRDSKPNRPGEIAGWCKLPRSDHTCRRHQGPSCCCRRRLRVGGDGEGGQASFDLHKGLRGLRMNRLFMGEPVDGRRSYTMSRIRGTDTGPELALRSAVHAHGVRFRTHARSVPGRPDFSNQRAKVAVFVDGCFWHRCPKHFTAPATRAGFWRKKIRRNVARRREVLAAYPTDWLIFEVFECELRHDLDAWASEIATAIAGRRASSITPSHNHRMVQDARTSALRKMRNRAP
jgi:DNA mismatch endonuclease, patch repair protein